MLHCKKIFEIDGDAKRQVKRERNNASFRA